jgi:hypothetical protein
MTFLRISVPVYTRDKWNSLDRTGTVKVSSEVDCLTEGYHVLKSEIDKLLTEVNAENRLAKNLLDLDNEIQEKTFALRAILRDIKQATDHYNDLRLFLEKLGIDSSASRLTFDSRFLLKDASLVDGENPNNESSF